MLQNNIETQIEELLKRNCDHQQIYYHSHELICVRCSKIIDRIIDSGQKLSPKIIINFLNYISKKKYGYLLSYKQYQCINENKNILSDSVSKIFSFHDPNILELKETINNFLIQVLKMEEYDKCFKILGDKNYRFDSIIYDIIKIRLLHFCDNWIDKDFCDSIINNINIDTNLLLSLCECRNTYLSNKIASIIEKHDGNINIQYLYKACKALPYSKQLINSLIARGILIDSQCIDIVCQYCDKSSIDFILSTGRLPITKENFKSLINAKQYIGAYNYNNITSSSDGFISSGGYSMEKMEVLIKYGYKPDYDDIVYSINKCVEIPGIERFNIKLDKKLLELCWDKDFSPSYEFDCIDPNLVELQKLCKKRSKNRIINYIKKYQLVPDRKCMENACCFRNNKTILEILVNNGGKFTYKCIKNCAKEFPYSDTLLYIINEYEKVHNAEIEFYKEKIKILEDKINSLDNAYIDKSNNDCVQDSKKIIKEELKEGENNEFDDNHLGKISNTINVNNNIISFNDQNIIIPSKRKKMKVPQIYREYFNKTDEMMSFLEIKKELIDKIRENNWYDKENQQLINLPNDLKNKLKLGDRLIKFDDLDKVIELFYTNNKN